MQNTTDMDQVRSVLLKLGFQPNHTGYKLLIEAIILYALDSTQCVTKELYPALAKQSHLHSAASVERSIRYAISKAWVRGSDVEWKKFFPHQLKVPSNMVFITTVVEYFT